VRTAFRRRSRLSIAADALYRGVRRIARRVDASRG
jgi:hypothetical protein